MHEPSSHNDHHDEDAKIASPEGPASSASPRRPRPVDYLEYEARTIDDVDAALRRGAWRVRGLGWLGAGLGVASVLAPRRRRASLTRPLAIAAVLAMTAFEIVSALRRRSRAVA